MDGNAVAGGREREREVVVGGSFTPSVCASLLPARTFLYFNFFKLDCPVPRYRRGWGVFLGVCRWPCLIFRG